MSRNGKMIIAMSGGVDSSVAACLLKDQGYEPVGVFMCVGVSRARAVAGAEAAAEADGAKTDRAVDGGARRAAGAAATDAERPRRLKHGCCSPVDAADARRIAGRLGIPFHVLNFGGDFDRIIDYFVDEYARARTPNPCILCNTHVKFGRLLRYADLVGAEYVATGHYARIVHGDGRRGDPPPRADGRHGDGPLQDGRGPGEGAPQSHLPTFPPSHAAPQSSACLARSLNRAKDQSYVLFGIRRANLSRCVFPVGEIADKAEVRRIAAGLGLAVHDKPDSQEICFVPDDDYAALVRERRPSALQPGEIRDAAGRVLGRHEGVIHFTVGQRRGLGVAAGRPVYVTHLNVLDQSVTVGERADLLAGGLVAAQVNWLADPPPVGRPARAAIQIRSQHAAAAGTIERAADGRVCARFDQPQAAVAPGQAAVFYTAGDVVLGGGWIQASLPRDVAAE